MPECVGCGGELEESFRFCPWCARPQRLKLTEFFPGHAEVEAGRGRALRVSRYLSEHHVRFSVWSEAGPDRTRVEAAVSLDENEAERLSRFLLAPARADADADAATATTQV
jgi:hypothetical protein